jgi:hypothetical protein
MRAWIAALALIVLPGIVMADAVFPNDLKDPIEREAGIAIYGTACASNSVYFKDIADMVGLRDSNGNPWPEGAFEAEVEKLAAQQSIWTAHEISRVGRALARYTEPAARVVLPAAHRMEPIPEPAATILRYNQSNCQDLTRMLALRKRLGGAPPGPATEPKKVDLNIALYGTLCLGGRIDFMLSTPHYIAPGDTRAQKAVDAFNEQIDRLASQQDAWGPIEIRAVMLLTAQRVDIAQTVVLETLDAGTHDDIPGYIDRIMQQDQNACQEYEIALTRKAQAQ